MSKIIYLKEYVNSKAIYEKNIKNNKLDITESNVHQGVSDNSLMVDVEGIHSVLTKNYNFYSPEALKKSCDKESWTRPYERPVIMHHNDEDGIIIGRIKKARYSNKTAFTEYPGITFTLNIPHKDGKSGVEDGRLLTTSIGVSATDVRCSICGENIAESACEHEKGVTYDGKLCYWIVRDFEPKEISYVIVPSDPYAKNVKVYSPKEYNKTTLLAESNYEEVNSLKLTEKEKELVDEIEKTLNKTSKEEENKEEEKKEEKKETEIEEVINSNEDEDKVKEKLIKIASDLERALASIRQELEIEKGQRETLEEELKEYKKKEKLSLIEKTNEIRNKLNMEEMDSSVAIEYSTDLLESTLKTYKEIIESVEKRENPEIQIKAISSKTIVDDEQDPAMKNTKNLSEKDEKISNTSLEEDLKNFLKF